jgi:hypothetical protein
MEPYWLIEKQLLEDVDRVVGIRNGVTDGARVGEDFVVISAL